MDAEGARALALRIAHGPPVNPGTTRVAPELPGRSRAIYGVEICRTERTPVVVDGRSATLVRRVSRSYAGGRWTTRIVSERLELRG
jgi:hypothetical protein